MSRLNESNNFITEIRKDNEFIKSPSNMQAVKYERDKLNKYRILCQAIKDCTKLSSKQQLDDDLKSKINTMRLNSQCYQLINIGSDGKLLGIELQQTTNRLDHTEREQLRTVLLCTLKDQYVRIREQFEQLTQKSIDSCSVQSDNCATLDLYNKLLDKQNQCEENLVKLHGLFECMLKMKLDELPGLTDRKFEEAQLKFNMLSLRNQILQIKVTSDVLNECSEATQAYKTLNRDIAEQKAQYEKKLADLIDLRERYKLVSCKQFDEILKTYVQYKNGFKKKVMINDMLKVNNGN